MVDGGGDGEDASGNECGELEGEERSGTCVSDVVDDRVSDDGDALRLRNDGTCMSAQCGAQLSHKHLS